MSAVALGVGLGSLAHRADIPVRPPLVFSRYGHPLRGPSGLHKAAFWKVLASRCAKAPLGVAHRFAPSRVSKIGLMQSGLRWGWSHSRRRFPVVGTPYAPPTARPCACCGTWALVRRCAQCFGQWPAASHLVCAPAHPGLRRCAASALRAGLPVRPPRGLPQPARLACWAAVALRKPWLQSTGPRTVLGKRATAQSRLRPWCGLAAV